ncbi:hypothetical protein [Streptomyces alkaliterrae]|uniref:Uncharacterized protein n=1 Tax=Streptomyces alkaliterrae TaxID=2213162 RepID=A0A5P0YR95_9ACTN|nr:hypothetical protein [Streptomyces alkaliterrae]MBB1256411.1 hypothetical protein [Streptomyces alkaliterrae]MBB1259989.1 hypothetical protein [Streptomyces alkaliterrae]MQS02851.1 hypothetical protein [Streptomyces alkaliterrae]
MRNLSGAVCDLASEVVSVLRDGGHRAVVSPNGQGPDAELGVAAVRVLGADVLLPSTLHRHPPAPSDLQLVREAVRTFPPGGDASVSTEWSHWAMRDALRRHDPAAAAPRPVAAEPVGAEPVGGEPVGGEPVGGEPDTAWLSRLTWQELTHQLAVLGALAVPPAVTGPSPVVAAAAPRTLDLARGFVRAVRRRDWLQAAGAGRWLAVLDSDATPVPATLGLETGLEFVLRMGGADPRVALHAHAAQLLRAGAAG